MKLIRPFEIDDAALLYSSIGEESGAVALEGDMTDGDDAEALEGDESGLLLYEGDEASPEADLDEWSATTLYALATQVVVTDTDYHHVFESLSGGTSSVVTITIATPGVVSWTAHGKAAGTPVTFTTTGALPTGLSVGTVYYVVNPATDTFQVAATAGGAAIATSGTQSGVHTAVANPNLNKNPRTAGNEAFWVDLGATNRWAMFDSYNTSQSTAPGEIEVRIQTDGRINGLALLNIEGAEVSVVSSTAADGEVYNETFSLVSTTGITDWYAYFFEDIVRKGDLVVTDIPPYVDQTITITITDAGSDVAIGTLVIGWLKTLGVTVVGAGAGITDYSRKDVDDFGNATIVERAFSERADVRVVVDTVRVDEVKRVLTNYRATPIVFIGDGGFDALQIFGFYKSFNLEIGDGNKSTCTLEIEGLT